ncbi:unnamed protein product [Withania somnifera]
MMKVIELSYNHLPHHLKPCFLYFASSPKGSVMMISVLKAHWRAEGLVEQTEMKSLEEVMEVYLDKLISSSLVICFNEMGDVPTCQLHDLVHDFCLIKAREENLFDQTSSSASSSTSSELMPCRLTIKNYYIGPNNSVLSGSKKKHLYSLKISGDVTDNRLFDTCHPRYLRLLRVLILESSFIKVKESLLNDICMLNHLRFLRIRTEKPLWMYNEGSTLLLLPRIWGLRKLQVLSITACSFFDMDEQILIEEESKLDNLRMLHELKLSYSKDTENIFQRFPNLQVLTFDIMESREYSTDKYWFPKLDFLSELKHLKVGFESSNTNDSGPCLATNKSWDFHFPLNLEKLVLWNFPLTSDSLSAIARLPNLEELALVSPIIQGGEWNMGEEDTFENLKFLNLYEVTLAKWEVGEESFPVLEKLELQRCHKLEEIPPSFGDICSLKTIKLVKSPQLEYSAQKIKEYVEDMGERTSFRSLARIISSYLSSS